MKETYVETLNRLFNEYKAKNPSFSLRAFARRLDIPPSALSYLLKGKRRLTARMADKLAAQLHLSPSEKKELLGQVDQVLRRKQRGQEEIEHLELKSKNFELISERIHFAILSLMKTKDFQFDTNWMAIRLKTSPSEVERALKNLMDLKIITVSEEGTLKRLAPPLQASGLDKTASITRAHLNDLESIREQVVLPNQKLRDYSSYTIPMNPKLLPQVQKIICRAQDEIFQLAQEEGDMTEVYRLNTFFYPLTDINDSNRQESNNEQTH